MSFSRAWTMLKKDLAVGPRSPIVLFALVMPLLLTLVLHLVFGGLLSAKPSLAIVDEAQSEIAARAAELAGIEAVFLPDKAELKRRVEANDFDGGLVLPAGFDRAVREGAKPVLELYISGESYAVNRLILAVTAIDLVREVEGRTPPVDVEVIDLGSGDPMPIRMRFVPVIAMYAFIIAGLFVPASSLAEERERRTLVALLVSPVRMTEVLVAKALLGIILTLVMTVITLALNGALGPDYASMLGVLAVAAVFWTLLGLIVGLASKNSETMFAIVKGSGAFLFAPVVFYIFPDWPQWIARIFPTYWAIDPVWRIIADGASLADVGGSLIVVAALSALLIPVIAALGRRAATQLAGG